MRIVVISVLFGDAVDAHCRKQGIPYKYPPLCHSIALHTWLVNMSLGPMSLCNCPLVFKCDKKNMSPLLYLGRIFDYEHLRRNLFSLVNQNMPFDMLRLS